MKLNKFIPHALAVLIFLIITYISFKPLFSGKVINQSDITQHQGMSKELSDFRKANGSEALWTNAMFGGMPAYQVSTVYPGNWISKIESLLHLFLPHPSGYLFMAFLGFFILLLCLEISPWLALIGALAYGFSSYFFIILEVGHNSKANAISYLPPILGGIVLLMREKYWLGFGISLLFMALELNANHVQITYYGFILFSFVFVAYFIRAIKEKKIKAFAIGVAVFFSACLISVLPNSGSLLATNEYAAYSTRGKSDLTIGPDLKSNKENKTSGLDKDYAVMYSHGIWETWTFLIPNFKGGRTAAIGNVSPDALKKVDPEYREQVANGDSYFGDQGGTSGPVYIGAIVIFLAVLGFFIVDHTLKWPLFIATILCLMLSWGKFFMGISSFFLDYVPGYNKFRAVSMILIIAELTLPLLAILAIDKFFKLINSNEVVYLPFGNKPQSAKKLLLISFAVVGGFCLIGYLFPSAINTFSPPYEDSTLFQRYKQNGASDEQISQFLPAYIQNLQIARTEIFKSDALRSFIFICLAAIALLALQLKKIKLEIFIAFLGICLVADLWPVANRYLNNSNFITKSQQQSSFTTTKADEEILKDKSLDFRVLNLSVSPFMDATTSYHHKSIGGYHGAKLKKYDELISFHLFNEMRHFSSGLQNVTSDSSMNSLTAELPVLNMLNTRYIIYPGKDDPLPILNKNTNGNAWFITSLKTVESADSEIVALYNLNTKRNAVIQKSNLEKINGQTNYKGNGLITLTSYQPNRLVYSCETKEKEFVVFSEIYYPKGWNAYIDGNLFPYTCVDYLLRGMEVPQGKHTIEFKFEPTIYSTGNAIALFGSISTLLAFLISIYISIRKKEIKWKQ